jgi:hypothetical protein
MHVNPIQERARYFGAVALNLCRGAAAGMFGVCKVPARAAMQYRIAIFHFDIPQDYIK